MGMPQVTPTSIMGGTDMEKLLPLMNKTIGTSPGAQAGIGAGFGAGFPLMTMLQQLLGGGK
jgi:hypothetical protein